MNSNNAAAVNKERPIISFCTDIKESVQSIEIDGEKTFNQYCYYIDNVADFYIKQLESSEAEFFRSNLWVPGDALWGLADFKSGESLKNNIITIFSRIISSIAYSLTLTNIWSAEQEIPPLNMINIRATAFYGQILLRKLASSNYFLYNGRCLNACGRIQSEAKLNSLIIGFIFSSNNDAAKQKVDFLNIELPEIEFDSMDEQIRQMLFPNKLEKCGCSIKFHTVKTEENKLLLHFATYPTKKLRGLEDTVIITTNVEFQVDQAGKMFRIEHREEGASFRKEYPVNDFESIDLINLIDLVADNKLGYLKEIYNIHNNIIFKYNSNHHLILEFQGEEHYPRAVNENGVYIGKRIIDFARDKYCILPVHDAFNNTIRDKAILIFPQNINNERSIIFTEIPSLKINDIRDYNVYYSSVDLCIKFKIE